MTSIEDLSDLILSRVFQLMNSQEQKELQNVSYRWCHIIEDFMKGVLVTGMREKYVTEYGGMDRLSVKAEFTKLFKNSSELLDSNGDCSVNYTPSEININTKKISLMGRITHRSLLNILQLVRSLTSINFHATALQNLNELATAGENNIEIFKLDLPYLKCLVLDDTGITMKHVWKMDFDGIFDSVSALMKNNKFPSLERLIFHLPSYEYKELLYTDSLVSFLVSHCETIKSFVFHQKFDIIAGSDSSSEEESTNKYVSLKSLAKNAVLLRKVNLEEIFISLACYHLSAPLWLNFMIRQTVLKKLYFIRYATPFPEQTIRRNMSTLTNLILRVKTPVNMVWFAGTKLKIVILTGGREDVNQSLGIPSVRNCRYLPHSVEKLKIHNLPVLSDDVKILALDKPNIKCLVLENIGEKYNLGMSLATYAHMVQKKVILHFKMSAAFNLNSFSDYKNIPKNGEGLSLIHHNSKTMNQLATQGYLIPQFDWYVREDPNNPLLRIHSESIFNFPSASAGLQHMENIEYDASSDSDSDLDESSSEDTYSDECSTSSDKVITEIGTNEHDEKEDRVDSEEQTNEKDEEKMKYGKIETENKDENQEKAVRRKRK